MSERTDDKMDKLTCLVSKINVMMASMRPNLNHKYIKEYEGDRRDIITLKMKSRQGIDGLIETETHLTGIEEDSVRIIHKIREGDLMTILGMTIGETAMEIKGMEIEVETIIEILIEIIPGMTIQETEILGGTGVEEDNQVPHVGEKTEEVVEGQCQDQHQDLGLDLV